jgi:hypothetical protein
MEGSVDGGVATWILVCLVFAAGTDSSASESSGTMWAPSASLVGKVGLRVWKQ